jgi:hypothetical protein
MALSDGCAKFLTRNRCEVLTDLVLVETPLRWLPIPLRYVREMVSITLSRRILVES